jgi:hypothetical protein
MTDRDAHRTSHAVGGILRAVNNNISPPQTLFPVLMSKADGEQSAALVALVCLDAPGLNRFSAAQLMELILTHREIRGPNKGSVGIIKNPALNRATYLRQIRPRFALLIPQQK